jgi:imidazoleglycerol-phosphate dehydratase
MTQSVICRTTAETDITLELTREGTGKFDGTSGIGFMDHMLTLFCRHSLMDLKLAMKGDLIVDAHHSVEDLGICLGRAFAEIMADKAGIRRYGSMFLPMDETLVQAAVDISGRPYLVITGDLVPGRAVAFDDQLVEEFFRAFAMNAGITLHIRYLYGKNFHHMAEAAFKAVARALREAMACDPRETGVPSTKGVL